ncbi:aspartate aminotransferase family protein [Allohahella marinimesophila]|uniref:Aspartate aminotransferase family protein n=1 Tax=Allohahella marinimesophila TaxID=1054972 RepID=A0ABP7Q439_9GAMM
MPALYSNKFGRLPLLISGGDGCWLQRENEPPLFDAISSHNQCNLGHQHPELIAAVKNQADRLMSASPVLQLPVQQSAGTDLCQIATMHSAILCDSGAEANELAIKLARFQGRRKKIAEPAILTFEGSFHGLSLATMSASDYRKAHARYEPLVKGFVRAPFNDLSRLRQIAEANTNITAVMVESVQIEAGIRFASTGFLHGLRQICDEFNWLLILDEIQTTAARTGTFFSFQEHGISPDVVTCGEALANGLPSGACLARDAAADLLHDGARGTSLGGGLLSSAVISAQCAVIKDGHLSELSLALGEELLSALKSAFAGAHYIKDIRGRGLLIAIEMNEPCEAIIPLALNSGLLIEVYREKVIQLSPPLIMQPEDQSFLLDSVVNLIKLYAGDDRKTPRH